MSKDYDILTQLARDQEQSETAQIALAKMYATIFNELLQDGLTRKEALDLTKTVIGQMLSYIKPS